MARTRHIDYLDGWRGLAIAVLLIGHFFPYWRMALALAGVNLFFVLSGLLMGRLLFVQEIPITVFYKRRISRIFPGLYFFIVTMALVFLVAGIPVTWEELIGAGALVRNYFPTGLQGRLDHIWSLAVEEHSYIVLSIVAIVARSRRMQATTMLAALSLLFAAIGVWYSVRYAGPGLYQEKLIHSEVAAFGIFVSTFFLMHFRARGIPKLAPVAYLLLALLGFAMHFLFVPHMMRLVVGVGSFALLINLLPEAPPRIRSALSFAPLRQLGIWSFSIYLWQQPFYMLVARGHLPSWAGLALALLAGIASFHVIENPARRYLNRVWAKRPPANIDALSPRVVEQSGASSAQPGQ